MSNNLSTTVNNFIVEYSSIIKYIIYNHKDQLKFLIQKYPFIEYNEPFISLFHSTVRVSFSDSDFFHQENDNNLVLELNLTTTDYHILTLDYLVSLNDEVKHEYMENAIFTFKNTDDPSKLTNVKPNVIYQLCYGFGVYGGDKVIYVKSNLENSVRNALQEMINLYEQEVLQDQVIQREMEKENIEIFSNEDNDHSNKNKLIWLKSQVETFINNRYATIYKDTYTSLSLIPIKLLE